MVKGFRVLALNENASMRLKSGTEKTNGAKITIISENPLQFEVRFDNFMVRKLLKIDAVEFNMMRNYPYLKKDTDYILEIIP